MTQPYGMHRRTFLRSAALAAGAAALPWRALGQTQGRAAITATPIDADSAVFSGAGANVFATRGEGGLILVDTGLAEHSEALLRAVTGHFGENRIEAAFNTHWHYDSTGGNAAVRALGARIYAHEYTRQWLDGDFWSVWEDRVYKPQPAEALPTDTFYTSGAVTIGGREVVYAYLSRAHTDGDIAVSFPDANITVAGGLVSVGAYPVLDYTTGGWIGAFARASSQLLEAATPETRIVPSLGPVVGRDHLQAQTDMVTTVRDRLYERVRKGWNAGEMLADGVTAEFDAVWGDPAPFINNAYPGIFAHASEVGGIV